MFNVSFLLACQRRELTVFEFSRGFLGFSLVLLAPHPSPQKPKSHQAWLPSLEEEGEGGPWGRKLLKDLD